MERVKIFLTSKLRNKEDELAETGTQPADLKTLNYLKLDYIGLDLIHHPL